MLKRTPSDPRVPRINRRQALATVGIGAASVGTALIQSNRGSSNAPQPDTISVLAPLPPDPAPPGVLDYLMPGLEIWEARHQAQVKYDKSAVENMKPKILINIRQGYHAHDVMYCAGWAQEIVGMLLPIDSMLTPAMRADIPSWSLKSFQWDGKTYGLPSVANPMILFVNNELMSKAGITSIPGTWDELVDAARATTTSTSSGWTMPAGQIGGIGGLMSQWLIFFLQAGGDLFDFTGKPTIATDAGVVAVEMLQRLLPWCDPLAFDHKSLIDASAAFMKGEIAMMMNWAVMYRSFSNTHLSRAAPQLKTAILPVGPVGTASIDSGDGWTIDARSWVPAKSMSLISFYLQPRVQKQMLTQTGWLPISLSALEDDDVRTQAPHADAVRQQLRSRIETGFRPNFDVMTKIIGQELLDALKGLQSPIAALRAAQNQMTAAAGSGWNARG